MKAFFSAIGIIIGLLLLLPGACSAFFLFWAASYGFKGFDEIAPFWVAGVLLGALGVFLLYAIGKSR